MATQSLYKQFIKGQGTKARIAFGQAGMIVSLILTAAILGLLPDRAAEVRENHAALAQAVAVSSSVFLTRSDLERMQANLETIVEHDSDILSAGIRAEDGRLVVAVGNHETEWRKMVDDSLANSQVFVPIWQGKTRWGQVELRFVLLRPEGWRGWLSHPLLQLILFMTVTSFLVFFFYLGRILKQLDPSQAIPGRVRSALDTLAEGLLVIDARQNIVLANAAFASIVGRDPDDLLGFQVGDFPWVNIDAEPFDNDLAPWTLALKEGEQQTNALLRLELLQGRSWSFMVNSSPVFADSGETGGVLISFDDVTEQEKLEIELQKYKGEFTQTTEEGTDFAGVDERIRKLDLMKEDLQAAVGVVDSIRHEAVQWFEEAEKLREEVAKLKEEKETADALLKLSNQQLERVVSEVALHFTKKPLRVQISERAEGLIVGIVGSLVAWYLTS